MHPLTDARRDHIRGGFAPAARRRARRSSAPCRMKAAAAASILLGALLARHVGLEHRALGADGGKPLVPEHDRKRGQRREAAEEGARRLGARTLGAVHVDGQAKHEAADLFALAQAPAASRRPCRTLCGGSCGTAWRSAGPDRRARCRSSSCRDRARRGAAPGAQPRGKRLRWDFRAGARHLPPSSGESASLSPRVRVE